MAHLSEPNALKRRHPKLVKEANCHCKYDTRWRGHSYLSASRKACVTDSYQIFHNYVRPHEGLHGKTPRKVVGIMVKGKNKWLTIIQNASS
jgi:hypothetical protein